MVYPPAAPATSRAAGDFPKPPRQGGTSPPPREPIRHLCVEQTDAHGPGRLYGPNIIDELTRSVPAQTPGARAAEIFWNVSTWHPYGVLLERTRIEVR